ncbi:MAG: hypothetical protein EZS28_040668, partial [Streblomastix strix]
MPTYRDLFQSYQIPVREPPDSNQMANRRKVDSFSGHMEAYQGRYTDFQGYKSILDKQTITIQPTIEYDNPYSESIQRESRSTRCTNLEGAAGRNSRGSVPELTEMDQSLLCDTEKGSGKMEKDNKLISIEQTSPVHTFHNGRYSKPLITTATQGLHGKDRSRVRISSHPSGLGFQTIPRFHFQSQILPVQSNVFRGQACSTHLPEDSSSSDQIHQRSSSCPNHCILRRYHHFTPKSRRTNLQDITNHQYSNQLRVQNINGQVGTSTSNANGVSRMADRFQFRSTVNDTQQIKEDKPNVRQMEKDRNVSSNGKGEIPGQLYRVSELPATTIQERRDPSEEAKQDQTMGSPIKRLECIDNSEHVGIDGDILVEVDGIKKQTDTSYNSSSSGNISNRCESYTLGSNAENARSDSRSMVLGQMESELASYQQQSKRSSSYSLRASPIRELLKRKIDKITQDRDRQQLSCIQHQSGLS